MAYARAEWLVPGGGVDLGGITRPHPAFRLASHFDGLASHSASLFPAKNQEWLARIAHFQSVLCSISCIHWHPLSPSLVSVPFNAGAGCNQHSESVQFKPEPLQATYGQPMVLVIYSGGLNYGIAVSGVM
ncbi:hypothetical protein C8R44DRAFT_740607 [Mycena epipterygia]|nr:hypothetical protein C8R44DRAFT_740607 [Mycena epipterygia]